MKLRELELGDRAVLILPKKKRVDKLGRLYAGIPNAGKEGIFLLVELKEGDIGRFE